MPISPRYPLFDARSPLVYMNGKLTATRSSLPVNDDVLVHILSSLPDFRTLQSFVLTCKSIYAIWRLHPRAITRGVLVAMAGPAWPCALRVARIMLATDILHDELFIDAFGAPLEGYSFEELAARIPSEEEVEREPITRDEAVALMPLHYSVLQLEHIFTQRYIAAHLFTIPELIRLR